MKKFAVLAALVALTLTAADAQAFGRRGGCRGGVSHHQPCVKAAPCCQPTHGAVIVTSPTPASQGEIRYFPQYQPAQAQPLPATTGFAAPVTTFSNGCANGTCTTTPHGFGLFRRR